MLDIIVISRYQVQTPPTPPTAPTPPTPPTQPTRGGGKSAVFLRLPAAVADALDATARSLDVAKSALVADLVSRHLDEETRMIGIDALRGAPVGRHSFTPVHGLEVLTLEQLATLLEVDVDAARDLAESGGVPGRKIGEQWRFSRQAVMEWLGRREAREP